MVKHKIINQTLTDRAGFFQISQQSDYATMAPITQLFVQYMTSLTITALNSALPTVFKKLVTWEGFAYAQEVNYTLARWDDHLLFSSFSL